MAKDFLTHLDGDSYQVHTSVRHLTGMGPRPEQGPEVPAARPAQLAPATKHFTFDQADWTRWKKEVTPALRRHVEAVENCTLCDLPIERVAESFTVPPSRPYVPKYLREGYGVFKEAHPDRGPQSAEFTVAFRSEHGHGPSFAQLHQGLGWDVPRMLGTFVVTRLISNEWLTNTGVVPWTLRPGASANAAGITLPTAYVPGAAAPARDTLD